MGLRFFSNRGFVPAGHAGRWACKEVDDMALKGRSVTSKASGITGMITGLDKNGLRVTFTKYQDVIVPLNKIGILLEMKDEVRNEITNAAEKLKLADKILVIE